MLLATHDLISTDGKILSLYRFSPKKVQAHLVFNDIAPNFKGFSIDKEAIHFNLKSTLAQLGVHSSLDELELDWKRCTAQAKVTFHALSELGEAVITHFAPGCNVGKLFAADDRRKVREPEYLSRLFGRSDRCGRPLLSLGGMQGSKDLILEKVDGRTVAYLSLQEGYVTYSASIYPFVDTLIQALKENYGLRDLIKLHQVWNASPSAQIDQGDFLLVRTSPLHILTMFGRVAHDCLPEGYCHTSADLLQPDTEKSGDIYELFGASPKKLSDIPLEFYTLEPYKEHISFGYRDKLHECLENDQCMFEAFETAPQPKEASCAVFVVKGEQLLNLSEKDWIVGTAAKHDFPGLEQSSRQAAMVDRYLRDQPAFPFLKGIEDATITSEGILLIRYFPSPLMKRYLLNPHVLRCIKSIYFLSPSFSHQEFFSQQDRAFLRDLLQCGMSIHWVDRNTKQVLRFAQKKNRDAGMFVPIKKVKDFLDATVFGIYGSNLMEGNFEKELEGFLKGAQELRVNSSHPLINKEKPLALVTGGGPGAMEVGNRIAKKLSILSCAHIIDFRPKDGSVVNEQKQNPYVEAKMTYRLDRLVERQAEFHLDFPIFLTGGIGTDFEYALEEVSRKVGTIEPTPAFLFGEESYWTDKITPRFKRNLEAGTIKGSEWVSNCFFVVQTANQALKVLEAFLDGSLQIGKDGPIYEKGFATID